jgi:hypothetical protein
MLLIRSEQVGNAILQVNVRRVDDGNLKTHDPIHSTDLSESVQSILSAHTDELCDTALGEDRTGGKWIELICLKELFLVLCIVSTALSRTQNMEIHLSRIISKPCAIISPRR